MGRLSQVSDPFWTGIMEKVRTKVIPYQWEVLNDRVEGACPSYVIRNFKAAAGEIDAPFGGRVFQDTDAYKWLEAVAFSLMWRPDPELEKTADGAIEIIAAAQQPDGYLDTYYILGGLEKRWTNLMANHELYCLGHMIEAAVAYYEATGKRKLMDVAIRFIDHVDSVVGREEGKLRGYPGHEVAEMGLMRLYRCTGEEKFLRLARYFIDERGQSPLFFEQEIAKHGNEFKWADSDFRFQYYQAGLPVREQNVAQGHAVRAVYLYSGMADVAMETGDETLAAACRRLWNSTVNRQMYVTGGIGSTEYGEAFSYEYDLPNDTVYAETCAAIGLVFFARRMLTLEKKGEYADVMERALYNGVISGMSLCGTRFFYVNPLDVDPKAKDKQYSKHQLAYERQPWLDCACCPPNLARLTTSLSDYISEAGKDCFYTHLFIASEAKANLGGQDVSVKLEGNYPWDGDLKVGFSMGGAAKFTYALRMPGWCGKVVLRLNGKEIKPEVRGGYGYIERVWQDGDGLEISFDMPVTVVAANPRVREDIGKVAVTRGPVVFCLEEADNGPDLHRIYLDPQAAFEHKWEPELLEGVVTLSCPAKELSQEGWDADTLYRPNPPVTYKDRALKWVPYYAWANRGENEMTVWVHRI